MPKCCVYDNPATMAREAWADGVLIEHITAHLLLTKGFNGHPSMGFYLNCGPWETGNLVGNKEAMMTGVEGGQFGD